MQRCAVFFACIMQAEKTATGIVFDGKVATGKVE